MNYELLIKSISKYYQTLSNKKKKGKGTLFLFLLSFKKFIKFQKY